jgi:hypothetical protein
MRPVAASLKSSELVEAGDWDLEGRYAQGILYGRPRPLVGGSSSPPSDAEPLGAPHDDSASDGTPLSTTGP